MGTPANTTFLFDAVAKIIKEAKEKAYRHTNRILLQMYWEIGQIIVKHEQGGQQKAEYGKGTLKNLSSELSREFGKGFDERNLNNMRAFYIAFPIWKTSKSSR